MSQGDIIALQHDAGHASLVHCQSSPRSLWRQPVFALQLSERSRLNTIRDTSAREDGDPQLDVQAWLEGGEGSWLEDVDCPVRVLYVGQSETLLQGPQLSAGLPQPGLYNLLVGRVSHLAGKCLCEWKSSQTLQHLP